MNSTKTARILYEHACAGKLVYTSIEAANAHIAFMQKEHTRFHRPLHAYDCPVDRNHVHVGGGEPRMKKRVTR